MIDDAAQHAYCAALAYPCGRDTRSRRPAAHHPNAPLPVWFGIPISASMERPLNLRGGLRRHRKLQKCNEGGIQRLPLAAKGFDPPRHFAAFLHTLRWNCVTATDPNLFQAPFRAGIKIDAYQMEPLLKALRLPRVNLFIVRACAIPRSFVMLPRTPRRRQWRAS
jgi:hypothetical protein